MPQHRIQWTAPAPLWRLSPDLTDSTRLALRRPAILRFATDSFMEEFNRTLETDPSKLATLEAQPETWRRPYGSAPAVAEPIRATSRLEQKLARLKVSAERRISMFSGSTGTALAVQPKAATGVATRVVPPPLTQLKLYQPAHQRFYLAVAALVCRQPGLPDRTINAAAQEKATFVVRRVRTTGAGAAAVQQEYGFIASASGGAWTRIQAPDDALAPGEEQLPLFFVNFHDDAGHRRRVLAGLIPTGRRETYVGASEQSASQAPAVDSGSGSAADPGAPPPPVDPRVALLSADFIEPWKALVQRAAKIRELSLDPGTKPGGGAPDLTALRSTSREHLQVGSWYVVLDFAAFLQQQLPDVWDAIAHGSTPPDQPQRDVVAAIKGVVLPGALQAALAGASAGRSVTANLADALKAIESFRDKLEGAAGDFTYKSPTGPASDWPDFLFPLADPFDGATEPNLAFAPPPAAVPPLTSVQQETQKTLRRISALRNLIAAALPATPAFDVPDLPIAAQPVMAPGETARFVIRCVFERPECGPLDPPLVSAPSRDFEIAAFFDPDAPARPIRISLPVDTSPAGIRRAPKNTAFMVSDMLCGQINRAKGMGLVDLVMSVLPFPLHKDLDSSAPAACRDDAGASLGMICSLSIPIITICALIILIIMVTLLDLIFHWLPFFFFCFPLPKFSAKSQSP